MPDNKLAKHHHRFFVEPKNIQGDIFISEDRELINQVKNVFRLKAGSEMSILDNTGYKYIIKITNLTNNITGKIVNKYKQDLSMGHINLFCSILKGSNFELVLQKCTEIGITEITPVIFQNSLIKKIDGKLNRWEKITKEAAEQSMRFYLPKINDLVKFKEAIKKAEPGLNFVADQKSEANLLEYTPKIEKCKMINIFVGPEGDFLEKERKAMEEAGFLLYNLGQNTLRSETACIVSAGIIRQIMI